MTGPRLLQGEQVVASIAGVTLTNLRVVYNFKVPFLTTLTTGRIRSTGSAPLQHVSAMEIAIRRYAFFIFMTFISGVMAFISAVSDTENAMLGAGICGGAAVLFFLMWLFTIENSIVISVDGTRFVGVTVKRTSSEVDTFLERYAWLKAHEWDAPQI